jgi:hypothetical protein
MVITNKKELIMKKLLFLSFMLFFSMTTFAEVGYTVVCSPCDKVPNTVFVGQATDKQIQKAQEQMMQDCEG